MTRPKHIPPKAVGRPPIERSEAVAKRFEMWMAVGVSVENAAKLEGLALATAYKLYRDEVDLGHIKANATVARTFYSLAVGSPGVKPDARACEKWLKMRAGWKEASDPQVVQYLGTKERADALARAPSADGWGELLAPSEDGPVQ